MLRSACPAPADPETPAWPRGAGLSLPSSCVCPQPQGPVGLLGPQVPLLPAPRASRGLPLLPCPGCSQTVRWAALGAHLSGILRVAARGSVFLPGEAQSRPGPLSVTEAPSPALLGGGAEGRAAPASGRRWVRWRETGTLSSAACSVPGWSVGRGAGGSQGPAWSWSCRQPLPDSAAVWGPVPPQVLPGRSVLALLSPDLLGAPDPLPEGTGRCVALESPPADLTTSD